jgi:hypothetical protein
MATEIKKITDLTFSTTLTLGVIDKDSDLKEIFTDEIKLPFSVLYKLSEEGTLNERTVELLTEIFEGLILTKKDLVDKYLRLASENEIKVSGNKEIEIEVEEPYLEDEEEGKLVEIVVESPLKKKSVKKEKTGKELPKWYGKDKIDKDIERQDGKATPVQRAMLKLNELKNLYFNLNTRGIKDMLADANTLSDEDCRKIVAAVTTFQRQTEEIMKKNKK